LDRDGDLDAMVVRDQVQGGAVWMNSSGIFTSTQTFDELYAASVELGDLDGDGDLDAFVAAQSGETSAVWLNNGHGVLSPGEQLGHLSPAALGDLDGDGDLDAFSVEAGGENVWLNQGDAKFYPSGQNLGLTTGTRVALGDLDGDGDLDAVTNGYNEEPSLWLTQTVFKYWFPWVSQEP
ncbi:MAG: FG-GAP-like repeat-containing protein, partial [Anaerolineales bacterium]